VHVWLGRELEATKGPDQERVTDWAVSTWPELEKRPGTAYAEAGQQGKGAGDTWDAGFFNQKSGGLTQCALHNL
jgi:hypothetical protein